MTIIHDPHAAATALSTLRASMPAVLYIGPDQIMPLTSILGAIAGVALMFWNRVVGLLVKARAMFTRSSDTPGKPAGK